MLQTAGTEANPTHLNHETEMRIFSPNAMSHVPVSPFKELLRPVDAFG